MTSRPLVRGLVKPGLLAFLSLLLSHPGHAQDSGPFLWEIGKPDGDDREFALAPKGYAQFKEDGFFVVGRSEAQRDWPYVQPGPGDAWAGGKPHTFTVMFGLKQTPKTGECQLLVNLVDTHSRANPELLFSLNGVEKKYQTPPGAGDDSIYGNSQKGKRHSFHVSFPASALKSGANELNITTSTGSWILYDWVGFQVPGGTELGEVTGSTISSAKSPPVLVRHGNRLMQLVQFSIRHFGQSALAQVRLDGSTLTNVTLRRPNEAFAVPVPAVDAPKEASLELLVSGRSAASRAVTLKPVRKWVVYLLPHSHVDIGYTHVQTDVERAQWRYIEMGIEAARKSAGYPAGSRFKWNTEVLWAVDSYLQQATPEKKRQFFAAVKAGWVGLDALYGNELTGLCRPEELIRLVGFATRLSNLAGVPIQSAMITDVPGYTWGIVPAFAQAGVKYFSIGPNGGDRIGHTIQAWGDKPFWWVGPNGKDRVLVWMTGTGYYRVFQSPEMLQDYLSGLEAKGYPYDMVQVRHCLGDNGAPDVDFADTVNKWNSTYAYPKLVISTTAAMFRDFERRYGDKLPVAKGDFTPYWEDGAASSGRETAMNRASADRLTQAEALFAVLNPKAYPANDFYRAWRDVILYDEHTWGAHNSISEPDAPFVKSQWAIKQANAIDGDKQSRELLRRARVAAVPESASGAIDVFNTSSWERTGLVTLPAEVSADRARVTDQNGKVIASQRLASGALVFVARRVPPFGAGRYHIEAGECSLRSRVSVENNQVTSPAFKLRINPQNGAVESLFSRALNRELVNSNSESGLNSYLYLPGSDLKRLQRNGPVKISVNESGPVLASILVESEAPGCNKLSREIRLVDGLDEVEVIDVVDKKAIRAKEGVHFGFSFNVPSPAVSMDVPWAVVRPEIDQIPGACKNWFTVQRWVDIGNKDYGVTWATPDAPLVEIGGITANLIGSLSDPKVWMDHISPSASIYSWAMNNHWHTNYRADQEGPTLFRYYIRAHKASSSDEAARFGISCAQPLLAAPARSERPIGSRLRVSAQNVLVSTLKPSDDGKALVVRLFESAGKASRVKLSWSTPVPREIWLSNAGETRVSRISSPLEVPAYGLITLRAELE